MKITVSHTQFDFEGFLNSMADFSETIHEPEHLPFAMLTEQDMEEFAENYWDELPERTRAEQLSHLEEGLKSGETLILGFAEPNMDEPLRCADGKTYEICCEDEDDLEEYCGNELTSAVLLASLNAETSLLTIETGLISGDGAEIAMCFYESGLGSLDKPAEDYVKRFFKS